jgi:hypothetical protein
MKKTLVDALISNKSTQWVEEDRTFLMNLEEDALSKMAPVESEEAAETEAEAEAEPNVEAEAVAETSAIDKLTEEKPEENMSAEDYIKKAPPEVQAVLRNGMESYNTNKAALIKIITANENNSFTKEQLAAKDLPELKQIASFATNDKEVKEQIKNNNYAGQGDPVANVGPTVKALELPVMDFSK